MKEQINRYKFDKISSVMAKEFGKIKRGEEDIHSFMLIAMEGNLLKLHRVDQERNGRRAIEAIHICLLTVKGYLTGTEYDYDAFLSDENKDFVNGLLMSFDPFTNDEVREVLKDKVDLESADQLRMYFREPIICMLRIEKSIELWTKETGVQGYFNFLESSIGGIIGNDKEMRYTIELQ